MKAEELLKLLAENGVEDIPALLAEALDLATPQEEQTAEEEKAEAEELFKTTF